MNSSQSRWSLNIHFLKLNYFNKLVHTSVAFKRLWSVFPVLYLHLYVVRTMDNVYISYVLIHLHFLIITSNNVLNDDISSYLRHSKFLKYLSLVHEFYSWSD